MMNPSIPNQYDAANAAFLADVAAATYSTQAEFAGCKTTVVASKATDTLVLLACDGEDCLVAFRGTQDLRNWLTDLDCAFTRLGNLRVHRGFYDALESVRHDLETEIAGTHFERLWLTGHSLGGALAMLCARAWEGAVEGVYTFGQPRAGDAAFRDNYNACLGGRTFRVVHADDIVPRVPWLLGKYRHAGHEVFFGSKQDEGGRKNHSSYVLDPSVLSKLPSDLWTAARELRLGKLALLNDHHISHYLALFSERPSPSPVSHS
jgi:predicted lipase